MSRKVIPGWRVFICEECGEFWKEECRDCQTPSNSECTMCSATTSPDSFELRPDWETDEFGNLIHGKEYI